MSVSCSYYKYIIYIDIIDNLVVDICTIMSDSNRSDDEEEEIVSEASFIPSDDDDDDDDYSDAKVVVQRKSPSMKSKPSPSNNNKPAPSKPAPSPRKVAKGTARSSKTTVRDDEDTVATKSSNLVKIAKRMVKNENDDEDFNSSLTPSKGSSSSKNDELTPKIKRPRTDSGRTTSSIYQSDGYDILVRPSILSDVATTTTNHEFSLLIQIDSTNTAAAATTIKPPIRKTSGSVMGRLELLLPSHHQQNQVKFDYHGTEYIGRVYPGPTAMVVSVVDPAHLHDRDGKNESLAAVLNVDQIVHEFCHVARPHPDHTETTRNVVSIPKVDYFQYNDINVNHQTLSTAAPTTTHTHDDDDIVSTKKTQSTRTMKKSKSTVTTHHNPNDHNSGAATTSSSSIRKTKRSKK